MALSCGVEGVTEVYGEGAATHRELTLKCEREVGYIEALRDIVEIQLIFIIN